MKKLILLGMIFMVIALNISPAFAASFEAVLSQFDAKVFVNGTKLNPERQPVLVNGRVLVPARSTLQNLGAWVDWYPDTGSIKISTGNTAINMNIGKNEVKINNQPSEMDAPPVLVNGTVMVPLRYAAEALGAEVRWDAVSKTIYIGKGSEPSRGDDQRQFIVVIDPGHGGSETGAIYGGVMEKNLNLDIAERLNSLLKEQGIKTYMTRENDTYVGLYDRSGLANMVNADLLISVHNNAGMMSTSGTMALYYPGTASAKGGLSSAGFASIVEQELTGALGTKNLGMISRPNLAVLRTSKVPAVIAEVGYMTNGAELSRLNTASFRQQAAEALKNAVIKALRKI